MAFWPLFVTVFTHAAHGPPVIGGEIRRYHFKLLDRVVGDLPLDAGPSGVLVIEPLGSVVAIQQK
jgi:hypothetical protein